MSTEDDMATLRRMKNDRKLSAADADALDAVDRMLRDLRMAEAAERGVSSGLITREKRDEVLAKTATFGEQYKSRSCRCLGALLSAADEAARRRVPLILTPTIVEHDTRWCATIGGLSARGVTAEDAANELMLRILR